jgi:hypothetical protein
LELKQNLNLHKGWGKAVAQDQEQSLVRVKLELEETKVTSAEQLSEAQAQLEQLLQDMAAQAGRVQALQQAAQDEELRKECPICLDAPSDCVLMCGHMMCQACVHQTHCPSCRKPVSGFVKMY